MAEPTPLTGPTTLAQLQKWLDSEAARPLDMTAVHRSPSPSAVGRAALIASAPRAPARG